MVNIENYLDDGANWQAQAVLAYLRTRASWATNEGYDKEKGYNYARLLVGRFENCREQGYVFTIVHPNLGQRHYAVFEHRNSDQLCIIKSKRYCINTPGIGEIWENRSSKYDIDKTFSEGQIVEAGEWIIKDMTTELHNAIEAAKEKENND